MRVSFLLEDGAPVTRTVTVAPTSRLTVYGGAIQEIVGKSFSITVVSDVPIIAERAMYWSSGGSFWTGGHESAGVPSPARTWLHAEGATGDYFDTYLLIGNPNDAPATITVTYLLPDGRTITRAARGRADLAGDHRRSNGSTRRSPTRRCRRQWNRTFPWSPSGPCTGRARPSNWYEAHNSLGVTSTALRWGFAEGCVGGRRHTQTYILVANPTDQAATVAVTFLPESGATAVRTFTVPATSRFNMQVGTEVPASTGACFGALVESTNGVPIAVERSMYWDAGGVGGPRGTNATAVSSDAVLGA